MVKRKSYLLLFMCNRLHVVVVRRRLVVLHAELPVLVDERLLRLVPMMMSISKPVLVASSVTRSLVVVSEMIITTVLCMP